MDERIGRYRDAYLAIAEFLQLPNEGLALLGTVPSQGRVRHVHQSPRSS